MQAAMWKTVYSNKLFQTAGAAAVKARSPMVTRWVYDDEPALKSSQSEVAAVSRYRRRHAADQLRQVDVRHTTKAAVHEHRSAIAWT